METPLLGGKMQANRIMEVLGVAELAAIAAAEWNGRGDKVAADQAATTAMREAFNEIDFSGRIVIGEGERDEAPMLFIGEELGLIGTTLVIVLFLVFLWAGMRICRSATTGFDAMLAGSLVIMITAQAFLNILCVIGLLPTTGKPLPFISSGGSSMIATLIMVGLILGVSEASDKSKVHEKRRDDLRVIRAR